MNDTLKVGDVVILKNKLFVIMEIIDNMCRVKYLETDEPDYRKILPLSRLKLASKAARILYGEI